MLGLRKLRKIVRMGRKSQLLDVLLPKTKQHLLSAILLQPDWACYLSELRGDFMFLRRACNWNWRSSWPPGL